MIDQAKFAKEFARVTLGTAIVVLYWAHKLEDEDGNRCEGLTKWVSRDGMDFQVFIDPYLDVTDPVMRRKYIQQTILHEILHVIRKVHLMEFPTEHHEEVVIETLAVGMQQLLAQFLVFPIPPQNLTKKKKT